MAKEKIVIADDDEFMRDGLLETLGGRGFKLSAHARAEDALADVADGSASLLLTDLRMPGMDGLQLLERARRLDPKLPVVMMTAFATVETAVLAMKHGAFDYIMKPFKADAIDVVVGKALAHRRLVAENEFLKSELDKRFRLADFVGESPAMKAVFERLRQIAPSAATVLIRGESGTGKELVAHALHRQSPRRERPFIRVNCAALGAGVLESELFGHERGAFTGADRRRIGRFEMADGGTLLLDEVSEMDLALQGKLLRVLQEKEFERVGSSETISVDVRVLASSNRDLERCIADGTFRHDLYYRLNVVSVDLPPLRQRREDIGPLARFFVEKFHREAGTPKRRIAPEALDVLAAYDWPGNVRELQNIIERALVLGTGEHIDAALIDASLAGAPGRRRPATPSAAASPLASSAGLADGAGTESSECAAAASPASVGPSGEVPSTAITAPIPLTATEPAAATGAGIFSPRPLDAVEREHVYAMLSHHGGARAKTAEALGISERSLRDRLKRWQDG